MKVVLVSPDQAELGQLKSQLSGAGNYEITPVHGNGQEARQAVERHQPDVLVVDGVFNENSAFEQLEKTIVANPGMAVILAAKTLTPEFLLRMMRMGVTEVLPQPVTGAVLRESIERAAHRVKGVQKTTRRQGKVLAMVGCKGGSGVTFLASNLGYAAASGDPNKRVILIDLNLQGGDAELFVSDGRSVSNVASIAAEINRLDSTLLDSSLVRVLPNYGVLAAAQDTHDSLCRQTRPCRPADRGGGHELRPGHSGPAALFASLYRYSPLHNLKAGVFYPATLATTADHDDRVVPAHSFRYIATLQRCQAGPRPVLIRVETRSGHGASSTQIRLDTTADLHAFLMENLGVKPRY